MYILQDNSDIEVLKVDLILYKILDNNNFPLFRYDGKYYYFAKTDKLNDFIKKHKIFIDIYSNLFIR